MIELRIAYFEAHRPDRRAYERATVEFRRDEKRAAIVARHFNGRASAVGAPGTVTAADIMLVWASGRCHYCGSERIGTDHVIPLSRGGRNDWRNLVRCCPSCNSRKGGRTPEEWAAAERGRD